MELLRNLELFSPTVENRFVFNLFDLLLCGVIVLVVLRGWRAHTGSDGHQPSLFLAFCSLGASFALGAVFAGAFLFFQRRLPQTPFDLAIHLLQASAWLLLATVAYRRSPRGQLKPGASGSWRAPPFLLPGALGLKSVGPVPRLHPATFTVLDVTNLLLLAIALIVFHRRPLGGRKIATGALAFVFLAALLHLGSSRELDTEGSLVLWNLEQFAWLLSLFTFALAMGETSRDLFDRVFVRLQIAFILLASLMILVITQTEKTEYLAGIRSRSDQLAEFVRAHVDYFRQRDEALPGIIEQEDFLRRVTLGFGNLPELKMVRIAAGGHVATFEIADSGAIRLGVESPTSAQSLTKQDPDEYFLIQHLPLTAEPGHVEFYSRREFLNQHARKRILLVFFLFTGMVALSTLMIGLVVRGASATIREQAQEIEETQRQLMQASRLAAIGELAGGVAHEINNPATTILSRASFLLSQEDTKISPSDREDLNAIVAQAQRIAHITRGLLMFSRPHALDIKPVSVDRLIKTALDSVDDLLGAGHIRVEKDLPGDLPRVLADEDSLARALENLFRNAIDAMPGGGTLKIAAAEERPLAQNVRLEISDTGVGIPADHLRRIFDPFFTTKEVGKGTGLGLSIAHGIIKEHGGSVTVTSQPGVGTQFVLALPVEQ